jgi:hypothetical protein
MALGQIFKHQIGAAIRKFIEYRHNGGIYHVTRFVEAFCAIKEGAICLTPSVDTR